jgi:uncharacterized protein
MDVTGNIFGCSRESVHKYCFGNVDSVKTLSEVYNSKDFKEYIMGSIARRNRCQGVCEVYDYCKGGCTDEAVSKGDITKQNPQYCYFFKTLYKHIKTRIDEVFANKVDLSTLNPQFKKMIAQSTSITEIDSI